MNTDNSQKLRNSWEENADAWIDAVRSGSIESRRLTTDAAILRAVLGCSPASILDLGCGEGWLTRALAEHGVQVVGFDASRRLVDAARKAGGGRFEHGAYDQLSHRAEELGAPFDAVVCNFSLLEENLTPTLEMVREMLRPDGCLLIQTLHPRAARDTSQGDEGWRTEHFVGMGEGFRAAMPWYARNTESWGNVIAEAGFVIETVTEHFHPETGAPLSLLLAARLVATLSA